MGSDSPFSSNTTWVRTSWCGLSTSPFKEYEWVGMNADWYYFATSSVLASKMWKADLLSSSL